MSKNRKYFSGNSLEQARLQAARFLDLAPEEVRFRRVERRHGFLKVRRRVVIEVDLARPRLDQAASADEERTETAVPAAAVVSAPAAPPSPGGATPAAPALPPAAGDLVPAAREALVRLFALGGLELTAAVVDAGDRLEVELGGRDQEELLEDRGRLLLAIQHLLPRLVRGLAGEAKPCRVDCDNFQEIRAERLRVLAQREAAKVRETARTRTLEPMSPDERRIVHLTLADDPAVETESRGGGLFKRITVRPARHRHHEPDSRG